MLAKKPTARPGMLEVFEALEEFLPPADQRMSGPVRRSAAHRAQRLGSGEHGPTDPLGQTQGGADPAGGGSSADDQPALDPFARTVAEADPSAIGPDSQTPLPAARNAPPTSQPGKEASAERRVTPRPVSRTPIVTVGSRRQPLLVAALLVLAFVLGLAAMRRRPAPLAAFTPTAVPAAVPASNPPAPERLAAAPKPVEPQTAQAAVAEKPAAGEKDPGADGRSSRPKLAKPRGSAKKAAGHSTAPVEAKKGPSEDPDQAWR